MVRISLTDFVDFVISAGTPKLTKVSQVKDRQDYDPATDFWKPLRDAIISFHQMGSHNKRQLDQVLARPIDDRKCERYRECIHGYKRFLGRKDPAWFTPTSAEWGPSGIAIRVNPELGLVINGTPNLVKLYFKADKLSKRRIDIILLLMQQALRGKTKSGIEYGVLDVPRGKLYSDASPNTGLLPLLIGEATSFLAIWQQI